MRATRQAIDRRKAGTALLASERLYRGIVESTREGVRIADAADRTTFVNGSLAQMLGCTVDELLHRPFSEFMKDAPHSDGAGRHDATMVRKDGTPIRTMISTTPLIDGTLMVVSDITDRYAAEQARRDLAAVVEATSDAIFRSTRDGIITSCNRGAERMYGYAAGELVGRHVSMLNPERNDEFRSMVDTVLRGERIESFETVRVTRDGRPLTVSLSVAPIFDAGGNIVGCSSIARDITSRKQVEDRFRIAAESMSDVIYEWDLDATLTWFGDIDRLMGFEAGEFPRTVEGWDALLHPDDRPRVRDAIDLHLRGAAPYDIEYRIRRSDGSDAVWISRAQIVCDERGTPRRSIGAITDVTSQRAIEHALRASEMRYRTLVDSIPDVTWTADASGRFTFVSDNALKMFGYTAEELAACAGAARVHPDDVNRVNAAYQALVAGGTPFDIDYRFRRKDGTWMCVRDRSVTPCDDNGITFAGILTDITARRQEEEQWRRVARERELLLESTADGFFAIDVDGRCTMANRVAAILLGCTMHELIGNRVHDLLHHHKADGSAYPREACPIYEVLRSGQPARITNEVFWRRDASSFPVEYVSSPIVDDGVVRGAVVTFSDVTDRRKLEKRLEQISHINSLGRMAVMIAHEFNNVLMGIQPFAEVIRRRATSDEKLQQAATQILNSVSRGKTITHDIMRMTRSAEPALQPVDVTAWIEPIAREIRATVGLHINVDIVAPPAGELFARCDPAQMQQVIMNLATNARDAIANGGTITLSAARCDEGVRIVVADTGCGIAAESLPFIFEPLFTTKQSGTGLGLAVAQQLVVRNGGTIGVDSVPGVGTRFRIDLPEAERVARSEDDGGVAADAGVQRVVIVEDDLAVASGLSSILEAEGIEACEVHLGNDAVGAVEAFRPDVVLIDISLPDIDGIEVYEQIAARWPALAVIFSTAHEDESRLPKADASHVGFLRKPYGSRTLLGKLREVTRSTSARG